jgi:hypothetical protein
MENEVSLPYSKSPQTDPILSHLNPVHTSTRTVHLTDIWYHPSTYNKVSRTVSCLQSAQLKFCHIAQSLNCFPPYPPNLYRQWKQLNPLPIQFVKRSLKSVNINISASTGSNSLEYGTLYFGNSPSITILRNFGNNSPNDKASYSRRL